MRNIAIKSLLTDLLVFGSVPLLARFSKGDRSIFRIGIDGNKR